MRLSSLATFAACASLALVASQANATVFAGNWTLTVADNSDPGHLKIFTDSTGNIFSNELTDDTPSYVDLFKIWTNESSIEPDDLNDTTLTLTFNFDSPVDNNGPVVVGGASSGYAVFGGFFQGGQLIWDDGGVAQLQWGSGPNLVDPGRMTLTVNGGVFNDGGFWTTDRNCNFIGRNCQPKQEALGVAAEFHWDNDPTFSAAPEPATWGLLIGGFGLTGVALRRRRGALVA
ncbi:MAG: sorting protein [Caulobacteraceae bacterium]|nr:sorting protein [Caulobacteraceae bacterium]